MTNETTEKKTADEMAALTERVERLESAVWPLLRAAAAPYDFHHFRENAQRIFEKLKDKGEPK